jgi:hypothetical protein
VLTFKNVSGSDVEAIATERRPVAAGDTLEVQGRLVTSRPAPKKDELEPEPLPKDAYVVEHNGQERLWPRATWELVDDKAGKPAAKADKEN